MKKAVLLIVLTLGFVAFAGCEEVIELPKGPMLTVEVVGLEGGILFTQDIYFDEGDTRNLLEVIETDIDLDYTVYDIGTFINGIAGIYPTEAGVTYNYYFAIYANDSSDHSGIQSIKLEDDLIVSFKEKTTLDETDVLIDRLIYSFIENLASEYINETTLHHYVIAAIAQLISYGYDVGELTDLIDIETVESMLVEIGNETIGNALKSIVIEKAFGLDTAQSEVAILELSTNNHFGAISLLTGLSIAGANQTLKDPLIDLLTTDMPSFADSDYYGMVLSALAPYASDLRVSDFLSTLLTGIENDISEDGMESWGESNAASTATVILGLVAQGINPRSEDYTVEDTDLIQALMKYEIEGTFKWKLISEAADMGFSTPQAFAALAMYKIHRDIWGNPPVDIFNFN